MTHPTLRYIAAPAILFATALLLPGCAGTTLPATEIALTAAERTALHYVTQPACKGAPAITCSDPATVAKIKAADSSAYAAVQAAKTGGSSATAAAAVAALEALLSAAGAKP